MMYLLQYGFMWAMALGVAGTAQAQAYGRSGQAPEPVQERVYEAGELSVADMVAALQPDPREGDKGYTPSGRWVKIAQADLDSCFKAAQSAGLMALAPTGAKNWQAQPPAQEQTGTARAFGLALPFGNNAHEPDAAGLRDIARFAQAIKDNSLVFFNFAIEGHANATGSAAQNKEITCRRAARIREILRTQHGVAAERLFAVGHGSDVPLAGVGPADGRNRRVTFRLLR